MIGCRGGVATHPFRFPFALSLYRLPLPGFSISNTLVENANAYALWKEARHKANKSQKSRWWKAIDLYGLRLQFGFGTNCRLLTMGHSPQELVAALSREGDS
jgi:hypothetical protein